MKVVILAGGFGTRISEESHLKPKPMIEIGEQPILWHIMKHYSQYGFNDFVICLGYKQYVVKEYFADYFLHTSDVTFDLAKNEMQVHNNYSEPWRVTLVDTGLHTMTGGRIKRIRDYIGDETFMLTYGGGVSNVDLDALVAFHKQHGKIATLTGVNIGQRFGVMDVDSDGHIREFREKNDDDGKIVNGGFQMYILTWPTYTGDADYGLSDTFHTGSATWANTARYSNPDVDALLDTGANTIDQDARRDAYYKAQELIVEDCPWVFLWNSEEIAVARSSVQGLEAPPSGRYSFNKVTFA